MVHTDISEVAARADHVAWRPPDVARLARGIKVEIALRSTAVALHVAGRGNAAADALFRFTPKATGAPRTPIESSAVGPVLR